MSPEQRMAISQFFAAVESLKKVGVIKTDRFLGDIGEFLCKNEMGMVAAKSARQEGHDGEINGSKVQVKYHGGSSRTVNCGNPAKYEILIVVLGPKSCLRPKDCSDPFLIYVLDSKTVQEFEKSDGKYQCGKKALPEKPVLTI